MSTIKSAEGQLSLRLRLWWRKLPMLVLIPLTVSGVGVWLSFRSEELAKAVGSNLIADGIMILVAILLIDRLAEARARRQRAGRLLIVYRDLRSIYTLTLSIWGTLLFVASKIQEEGLTEEAFAHAFDERIGAEPFGSVAVESLRGVGEIIANHADRELILKRLRRTASDVSKRIEEAQRRHDSHLETDQFLVLEELRKSVLIVWLGENMNFDLHAFGGNLLFTADEKRKLNKMFEHDRDDTRALDILPQAEDHDIQELIPLLGSLIDRIADELLLRDAYRVPRTVSPARAYYG